MRLAVVTLAVIVHAGVAHAVPFDVGARELHDGDAITIDEVTGDRDDFAVGGTYTVRGRYTLASVDEATLLFSLTEKTRAPSRRVDPRSTVVVRKGSGRFTLTMTFPVEGWPHVTLYGRAGKPIGGVYFGSGAWLLVEKRWRYRDEIAPRER